MYRTRTFHTGHKLVGTAHFALADLLKILDKPSVCGKIPLNTKKHQMASGHLVVELQLRTVTPSASSAVDLAEAAAVAHSSDTKTVGAPTSVLTCSANTSAPAQEVQLSGNAPSVQHTKQQLYAPDTSSPTPTKSTAGSIFSAWFVMCIVLTLMVTTCSARQFLA
jgi:cobalamin biosynthesis Mg chelatase CobN